MKSKKGFTLIELTIVVVIMSMLVLIAIPFFKDGYKNSKEKTDLLNLKTLNTATDLYRIANEDNDLFIDGEKDDEDLMAVLIQDGYIENTIEPVYEGASFTWDTGSKRWAYQKPAG